MSVGRPMKRLLALRVIEEEREEAELRKQRQQRQTCLDALKAFETRKAVALRALHTALESGDRISAIFAEMEMACGPMQRHLLQRRLAQLDAMVEEAAATWRGSRVRRLQIETLVETAVASIRKATQTREQKTLDGWFLSSRPQRFAVCADESSQREAPHPAGRDGIALADSVPE